MAIADVIHATIGEAKAWIEEQGYKRSRDGVLIYTSQDGLIDAELRTVDGGGYLWGFFA